MSRSRCVLLFSRSPLREGTAKGLPDARQVFDLARRRIAVAARSLPGVDLVLIGDGPGNGAAHVLPQRGKSFGERLDNAFADVRALGYDDVVAVPGDVPGLGRRFLEEAFAALRPSGLVLGPSPDGGVYLIGITGDPGSLFASIRWLTPRVTADLLEECGAAGRPVTLLRSLADLDRRRDVSALAADPGLDAAFRILLLRILASPEQALQNVRAAGGSLRVSPAPARAPPSRASLAA